MLRIFVTTKHYSLQNQNLVTNNNVLNVKLYFIQCIDCILFYFVIIPHRQCRYIFLHLFSYKGVQMSEHSYSSSRDHRQRFFPSSCLYEKTCWRVRGCLQNQTHVCRARWSWQDQVWIEDKPFRKLCSYYIVIWSWMSNLRQ